MLNRVFEGQTGTKIHSNRLGRTTSCERSEILERFARGHSECPPTWIRPEQNRHERSRSFPLVVRYFCHGRHLRETNRLFRLFFVFLNSFYSFYWDVAKDWDLTLFASSSERNNPEHPWGLRRHTHFHSKEMYYGAIAIDFMLRCTWSFKLSPHLDHFNDLEGGIFIMEMLEVLRRWMWIFFRVETEWGKYLGVVWSMLGRLILKQSVRIEGRCLTIYCWAII